MAEITDNIIPEHVVPESYERQTIRVKLNGPGGQFPTATINLNDLIHTYFSKNGGGVQELQDTYKVTIAPKPGKIIVAYYLLRLIEEDIQ
jgi:hypothetical protein